MRQGKTEVQQLLTVDNTNVKNKLEKNEANIIINAFRIAVNGALSIQNMIDGIVDEYEDESGIIHIAQPFCHMALENNTDDGTGANAVTNIGTPTYTSGKLNNALTLDGSTDALNVNALATDIASDTTGAFSFWVNVTSSGMLVGLGDTDANRYFEIFHSSSKIYVRMYNGGWIYNMYGSTTIATSTWYHVAVVQEGVAVKIYVNGDEETLTGSNGTAWLSTVTGLDNGRIGATDHNSEGNGGFFTGQIDDFRYYQNKALTSDEVAILYNSGNGTEDSEIGSQNISYNSSDDYYSPESLPQPFSHMALEDNTDDGTGANSVTNIGTPTYTSGKLNNALTLTTNQALNVNALRSDIIGDTTGSFAFWFKADSINNSGKIITFGDTNGDSSFGLYQSENSGRFTVNMQSSAGQVYWYLYGVVTTSWQYWVFTQDGSGLKIYLDGTDITPENPTGTSGTGDATKWLAHGSGEWDNGRMGCSNQNNGGDVSFLEGQIDDFRYYQNKALTSDEVALLYNSGNGTEDSKLSKNMTLISEAFTAEAEADTSRIVLLEEDVDSITLNTDLKAYASRDGGSSWVQGTLTDEGDYDTSKQILVADFDLTQSGIGSGTDMEYKLETLNNKDLNIHASGLTWG